MASASVISYGEVLWDLLPSGRVLGGAPLNLALRLNQLGTNTTLISRVGRDPLGDEISTAMHAFELTTNGLQHDQHHATGTVDVTINSDGNPSFAINKGVAYDFIEVTPQLSSIVSGASCFCFGTLIQRSEPSRKTLYTLLEMAPQAVKVLDINLRKECYTPEIIFSSMHACDILKLNGSELRMLSDLLNLETEEIDLFSEKLCERFNLQIVITTLGERGAYAYHVDGHLVYAPELKVSVVDTVGSGDAFTAGFLHNYPQGQELLHCTTFGNALGALVATQAGATQPIDRNQLLSIM